MVWHRLQLDFVCLQELRAFVESECEDQPKAGERAGDGHYVAEPAPESAATVHVMLALVVVYVLVLLDQRHLIEVLLAPLVCPVEPHH